MAPPRGTRGRTLAPLGAFRSTCGPDHAARRGALHIAAQCGPFSRHSTCTTRKHQPSFVARSVPPLGALPRRATASAPPPSHHHHHTHTSGAARADSRQSVAHEHLRRRAVESCYVPLRVPRLCRVRSRGGHHGSHHGGRERPSVVRAAIYRGVVAAYVLRPNNKQNGCPRTARSRDLCS